MSYLYYVHKAQTFGYVFSKFHSQYSAALDVVSYIYGNKLFMRTCCDRTKQISICCKVKEGQFRLVMRQKFFTMKAIKQCHKLSRKMLDDHTCKNPGSGVKGLGAT